LARFNKESFADLDSTSRAEAMLHKNFHVQPQYPEQALPVKQQMDEVTGKAKEYPTPEYANLMSTLRETRKKFLS